jgi:hypothetical protein
MLTAFYISCQSTRLKSGGHRHKRVGQLAHAAGPVDGNLLKPEERQTRLKSAPC